MISCHRNFLLLICLFLGNVAGFVQHSSGTIFSKLQRQHSEMGFISIRKTQADFIKASKDTTYLAREDTTPPITPPKNLLVISGVLSLVTWVLIAILALSYHPDPKFANCSMRHNILTMSQAFAFPIPVGWAAFSGSLSSDTSISSPLKLGIALSSMWLAGACIFPPKFAFGYDLYSRNLKIVASLVHLSTFSIAFSSWLRSLSTRNISVPEYFSSVPKAFASSLWSLCVIGLLWFSIQPILAPYPLATVPTILGKRLSRPASAFTFLASICAQTCNSSTAKEETSMIRKGLFWGSSLHLTLISLKLIGIDGGGFILPGRGLWEVYPAMLEVPFATALSILVHTAVCFAATG